MNKKIMLDIVFYMFFIFTYVICLISHNADGPVRYDWVYSYYTCFTIIFFIRFWVVLDKLWKEVLYSVLISFISYFFLFVWFNYSYFGIFDFLIMWVYVYFMTGGWMVVFLMRLSNYISKD